MVDQAEQNLRNLFAKVEAAAPGLLPKGFYATALNNLTTSQLNALSTTLKPMVDDLSNHPLTVAEIQQTIGAKTFPATYDALTRDIRSFGEHLRLIPNNTDPNFKLDKAAIDARHSLVRDARADLMRIYSLSFDGHSPSTGSLADFRKNLPPRLDKIVGTLIENGTTPMQTVVDELELDKSDPNTRNLRYKTAEEITATNQTASAANQLGTFITSAPQIPGAQVQGLMPNYFSKSAGPSPSPPSLPAMPPSLPATPQSFTPLAADKVNTGQQLMQEIAKGNYADQDKIRRLVNVPNFDVNGQYPFPGGRPMTPLVAAAIVDNQVDNQNKKATHQAMVTITQTLLTAKATPDTALQYAKSGEIADLLVKGGAKVDPAMVASRQAELAKLNDQEPTKPGLRDALVVIKTKMDSQLTADKAAAEKAKQAQDEIAAAQRATKAQEEAEKARKAQEETARKAQEETARRNEEATQTQAAAIKAEKDKAAAENKKDKKSQDKPETEKPVRTNPAKEKRKAAVDKSKYNPQVEVRKALPVVDASQLSRVSPFGKMAQTFRHAMDHSIGQHQQSQDFTTLNAAQKRLLEEYQVDGVSTVKGFNKPDGMITSKELRHAIKDHPELAGKLSKAGIKTDGATYSLGAPTAGNLPSPDGKSVVR